MGYSFRFKKFIELFYRQNRKVTILVKTSKMDYRKLTSIFPDLLLEFQKQLSCYIPTFRVKEKQIIKYGNRVLFIFREA